MSCQPHFLPATCELVLELTCKWWRTVQTTPVAHMAQSAEEAVRACVCSTCSARLRRRLRYDKYADVARSL